MTRKYSILFCFCILIFQNTFAQTETDSTVVKRIVENFFSWYAKVIKENASSEYLPQFVEGKNGKTTLNYSIYINNLKRLSFSDELIKKEKESYQVCIEYLSKINYSDFDSIYDDLDDFELSKCDFSNYYRWTGSGLEPIDGIVIKNVNMDTNSAEVIVQYYNFYPKDRTFYYWNNNSPVILKRESNGWKIDEFK
jgi:hypothetical protein